MCVQYAVGIIQFPHGCSATHHLSYSTPPHWPKGKASASQAADLGSIPAFTSALFPDNAKSLGGQPLKCQFRNPFDLAGGQSPDVRLWKQTSSPQGLRVTFRIKSRANTLHHNLSHSLADLWGTTVDFTTNFLHSSQLSVFRSMLFHSKLVHSLMLSSHCFFCLPLCLPPCTVPCRVVLACPDDLVTCLYHFSLHPFTEVRKSSYSLTAFPILVFSSSLAM